MRKQQTIYEARIREDDWRYGIWKLTYELCGYPIQDGKDTFRYTVPKWVLVDVVVGHSKAEERIKELSKH